MRSRHWAEVNEVTFVTGIKFLFLVFRFFGRWPFRVLVYPIALVYMLRNPAARAASRAYLVRVWRSLGRPASEVNSWLMLRQFAAFSEGILDKILAWTGRLKLDHVVFHGHEAVAARIAQGQGGLLISGHLGNIELCRALSKHRPGLRLTVLVHTKHAKAFNALLAEFNPESSMNLLQVTEMTPATAILLRQKVERGEYVVIAGDRVPVSAHPRVALAEFLGEPAAFPIGPYLLASLLQCPVYLMFCVHQAPAYHVYYELFRERIQISRRDRGAACTALAAAYADRLAHYCRIAPLQWFNFYDFWAPPQSVSIDAAT